MTELAVIADRERRARLANMRQELLAPATALAGYGELLTEEADRLELGELAPDLKRILTAAHDLLELVNRLLDEASASDQPSRADLDTIQTRMRHDLRNPLNAIKGYAELLLEELDEQGGAALRADLEALLGESESLLARIDVIVDFSRGAGGAELAGQDQRALASMVANLVRTVKPIEARDARSEETGRILVVDDNASNRDLLFRRLSRDGHRVTRAESGQRALEILAVEEFDLVLLDLMMPDLNGFQVLERLKADERLHDVPAIMISGLQETDSVIRCIEAGAEDYLTKPFKPVLLRARISACLERKRWRERERRYLERIELDREKYEVLLRNILPGQIVTRLNDGEVVIADRVKEATILFADLVGFTEIASRLSPARLVDHLNRIFSEFDGLCRKMRIEKIKTIGDAYMAAAGLPQAWPGQTAAMAEFALAMLASLERINQTLETPFQIRIGVHTGPVIAGVIGVDKFIYDVWGETVNLASRLEAHGVPGRIHISEATRRALAAEYESEPRGLINVKGMGKIRTSFLGGRKIGAALAAFPGSDDRPAAIPGDA
ncbi:MAG TPA: adenylate/guanylate cyclase domain-containing protein [Geminicoccaceae bacterium]|nr:adenylate/guanylate cyclase domain-containing protein [Geminicoccaceae bacterium]